MASSTTAQSLLSLPAGVTDPGPYTVFGLRPGESDAAAIAQAIKATVVRLNAAKPNADPAAWQQAALWVKRARGILLDPSLKAQLDQRSVSAEQSTTADPRPVGGPPAPGKSAAQSDAGAAAAQPSTSPVHGSVAVDPLAGLLPGASAAVEQASAPVFRAGPAHFAASRGSGPQPSGRGPLVPPGPTAGGDTPVAVSGHWSAEPVPVPMPQGIPAIEPVPAFHKNVGSTRRRRRRFPWAATLLTLLTLSCVVGIVGMIYVLDRNPGGIVINLQPGSGTGPGASTDGAPVAAVPPPDSDRTRQPTDPIMGRLGPEPRGSSNRSGNDPDRLAAADDWLAGLPDSAAEEVPSPSSAAPQTAAAQADATTQPPTEAPERSAPPSAAQSDAVDAAIAKAREAIGKADWDAMVELAEAAQRVAATKEHREQASRLFQLAELATYYHNGIEKGLDGLGAGESFDVTDQLQIVVVEIGTDKLVFRFSGRNKDYPRRELPLVLAHRIARFAMDVDDPTVIAASNAYQAVAPVSTPQYRQQAITALETMAEPVEGAQPADLAAAIRNVFGE